MGQYFLIVNLTKKEYLDPHNLGGGLKLWEICANSVLNVLGFLLRKSSEGGGDDIQKDYKNAGRWAGDRIVVIGNYDKSKLYDKARQEFTEITAEIREEWNEFIELEELKICRIGFHKCFDCGKENKDYVCKKCREKRRTKKIK